MSKKNTETPKTVTTTMTEAEANELERLRQILFGAQNRKIEERLEDLVKMVADTRQDAAANLAEQVSLAENARQVMTEQFEQALARAENSFNEQLNALQKEMEAQVARLEQEAVQREARLKAEIEALSARLAETNRLQAFTGDALVSLGQRLQTSGQDSPVQSNNGA